MSKIKIIMRTFVLRRLRSKEFHRDYYIFFLLLVPYLCEVLEVELANNERTGLSSLLREGIHSTIYNLYNSVILKRNKGIRREGGRSVMVIGF